MITKSILDSVFDRSFAEGNYLGQVDKLDAQGQVDRRKMFLMTIKLMEEVDRLEERVRSLEDASRGTKPNPSKSV
jgi:hypothetical protein